MRLPLSWDDPATQLAIRKYMQSVRPDAPWCPSNIEFIRRINGLNSIDDVHRIGALHGLNMCPPLEKPFRREAIQRAIATLPLFGRPEVAVSLAPLVHQPGDVSRTPAPREVPFSVGDGALA